MPRDGSGVYTLPTGNPVVSGTTIASTWANTTMADVAVQLNNVLTRDGVLGPILPFKLVDGTQAAPGLAFASEPAMGLWRPAATILGVAEANATIATFDASNIATTLLSLFPRSAGAGDGAQLRLSNGLYGATNSSGLLLSVDDARAKINAIQSGTGALLPLQVNAQLDNDGQVALAVGQCQFSYVSTTQCILTPYNGNKLTIGDFNYRIPAAGVTLSNTGLSANTIYNVYAYQTAGVIALEASTTARATDATTGMPIKSGDRTRTLVGKIIAGSTSQFIQLATYGGVLSWFNRRSVVLANSLSATATTSSTTPVALASSVRLDWLSWGDGEGNHVEFNGYCGNNTGGSVTFTSIGYDGVGNSGANTAFQAYAAGAVGPYAAQVDVAPLEGVHFVIGVGWTGSGIGTWYTGLVTMELKI